MGGEGARSDRDSRRLVLLGSHQESLFCLPWVLVRVKPAQLHNKRADLFNGLILLDLHAARTRTVESERGREGGRGEGG